MKIEKIKLNDIIPTDYNPRTITNEEIIKLQNSINTFGMVDPIIINLKNNHIIGGHQRYNVLQDLYMQNNEFDVELNLIRLGDVGWVFPNSNLKIENEDYEKALNLALNKIKGNFDFDKLKNILIDLKVNNIDLPYIFADEQINIETENSEDIYDFLEEENIDFLEIQEIPKEYSASKESGKVVKFPLHNKFQSSETEYQKFKNEYLTFVNENNTDERFITYLLNKIPEEFK